MFTLPESATTATGQVDKTNKQWHTDNKQDGILGAAERDYKEAIAKTHLLASSRAFSSTIIIEINPQRDPTQTTYKEYHPPIVRTSLSVPHNNSMALQSLARIHNIQMWTISLPKRKLPHFPQMPPAVSAGFEPRRPFSFPFSRPWISRKMYCVLVCQNLGNSS